MTATKRVAEKGGMGIWYGVPVIPNVLVDQILTAKQKDLDADTSVLESQIEQKVYKLYELREDEIKIVEKNNKE